MAKSTSVAKVEKKSTAVATNDTIPDWMAADAGMGMEGIDQSMLTIPRISLLHATSVPVQEGLEGAVAGNYWHKTLNESIGKDFAVIPVYIEKGYLLWNPEPNTNEVLARGVQRADGVWVWDPSNTVFEVVVDKKTGRKEKWDTSSSIAASGLTKWADKVPPAGKEVINVLFALPDLGIDRFAVMSFMKSSFSIGRKFAQAVKEKERRGPAFGLKFTLGSQLATANGGERYLEPVLTPAGFNTDREHYEICKAMSLQALKSGLSGIPAELDDSAGDTAAPAALTKGDKNY